MARQELIDGVWQDVPRPARVRELSDLSEEEAEELAETWAVASSEEDRNDVLRRAGVSVPESQGDRTSESRVARQVEQYWKERMDAAEQMLRKRGLERLRDTDALVGVAEALILGNDDQAAVEQARLEDPQRRARLAEKQLQSYGIRIPRCDDDIFPWGIIAPEEIDEDDWLPSGD